MCTLVRLVGWGASQQSNKPPDSTICGFRVLLVRSDNAKDQDYIKEFITSSPGILPITPKYAVGTATVLITCPYLGGVYHLGR